MTEGQIYVGGAGAIRQHLFVLAPNNSGSTFLTRALGLSPGAWSLPREAQHVEGFAGPSSRGTGTGLLWASTPENLALFTDPAAYDWERSRRAWHFQAEAYQPDASVLALGSPPFLLIAKELATHFVEAQFLVMVRNPYAMVEGILRGTPGALDPAAAARHVMVALQHQRANQQKLGERAICFDYETMCREPDSVAAKISALVPQLGGVLLSRKLPVKGNYDEELRDMNADQIARLTPHQISAANSVFDADWPLLEYFGYAKLA